MEAHLWKNDQRPNASNAATTQATPSYTPKQLVKTDGTSQNEGGEVTRNVPGLPAAKRKNRNHLCNAGRNNHVVNLRLRKGI